MGGGAERGGDTGHDHRADTEQQQAGPQHEDHDGHRAQRALLQLGMIGVGPLVDDVGAGDHVVQALLALGEQRDQVRDAQRDVGEQVRGPARERAPAADAAAVEAGDLDADRHLAQRRLARGGFHQHVVEPAHQRPGEIDHRDQEDAGDAELGRVRSQPLERAAEPEHHHRRENDGVVDRGDQQRIDEQRRRALEEARIDDVAAMHDRRGTDDRRDRWRVR